MVSTTWLRRAANAFAEAMSRLKMVEKVARFATLKNAQGADRHMQVDRIDIVPEQALPLAARQQIAQGVDGRHIEPLDRLGTREVGAVQNVLVHDEAHEFGMCVLVVEGECNEGRRACSGS